ncbi:MAG: hypothetical protein GY832_01445 [Chloroflexi bacterium]|nr:hypothetical protein [Chloroflexota bacterium]
MSERKRTIEDMRPLHFPKGTSIPSGLRTRRVKWMRVDSSSTAATAGKDNRYGRIAEVGHKLYRTLPKHTEVVHVDDEEGGGLQAIVLLCNRHFPIVSESEQFPEYNHEVDKPMVEKAMEEGKIKSKEAADKLKAEADARARGEHLRPRATVAEADMEAEVDETESPNAEEIKSPDDFTAFGHNSSWMLKSRQLRAIRPELCRDIQTKGFFVTLQALERYSQGCEWSWLLNFLLVKGLPSDSMIAEIQIDKHGHTQKLIIWSRSFPVIPVTEEIPEFGEPEPEPEHNPAIVDREGIVVGNAEMRRSNEVLSLENHYQAKIIKQLREDIARMEEEKQKPEPATNPTPAFTSGDKVEWRSHVVGNRVVSPMGIGTISRIIPGDLQLSTCVEVKLDSPLEGIASCIFCTHEVWPLEEAEEALGCGKVKPPVEEEKPYPGAGVIGRFFYRLFPDEQKEFLKGLGRCFGRGAEDEPDSKPESEPPHPHLCIHHGGSPECEKHNLYHGFTCPKCAKEEPLFTKGERVYTPDGPGSVIEYPVTDCTMIDVQLETSEDGVDNELRYPVNVVETEEEKIVNEAYENQRQSRKQSGARVSREAMSMWEGEDDADWEVIS